MEGLPAKARRVPGSFAVRAIYSTLIIAAVVRLGTLAMLSIEGWSYLDFVLFHKYDSDWAGASRQP
jgi:hypothetical protein